MRALVHYLTLFLFSFVALFIQQSSLLVVGGIRPNILLMMGMTMVVLDRGWISLLGMCGVAMAVVFILEPFWIMPVGVCMAILLLGRMVVNTLTGNALMDYYLLLLCGECALMGVLWAVARTAPSLMVVGGELLYTCGMGMVVWILGSTLHRATLR